MKLKDLKTGEQAKVTAISGSAQIKKKLLVNGISIGAIVKKHYSPALFKIIYLSSKGKMLGIRMADTAHIEIQKLEQ